MKSKIKVVSTLEQVFEINWEKHDITLIENNLLQSKLLDESNNNIGSKITHEFTPTELKYGIISFGKKHPLASLHKPKETLQISVDGKTSMGKWHSNQVRIDGLTRLFSICPNIDNTVYEIEYSPEENILYFIK